MERIERTALSNLIHNEEYTRKVLPFIKEEYFADRTERLLFSEIYKFVNKYNSLPTKEALSIEINSTKSVNEDEYKKITDVLSTLNKEPINYQWLVDTTEKFCKDRAIIMQYLVVFKYLMVKINNIHKNIFQKCYQVLYQFHLTKRLDMIIY
tara:strand:- start:1892 stop:2347 length:456 start_codon:yes stop_codon:yes gene_type:complete